MNLHATVKTKGGGRSIYEAGSLLTKIRVNCKNYVFLFVVISGFNDTFAKERNA